MSHDSEMKPAELREDERFAALTERGSAQSTRGPALSEGGPAAAPPATRYEYGTHPDQFVEVFGDPASASATVILVHGGYFRPRTDLTHARPMAAALAAAGLLCVLVEYRRVGGQPNPLDDVSAAIAFTCDSLTEWGAGDEAQSSLTVTGHSAGGALVLTWASHLGADGSALRLRPLAPITDLFREVAGSLGDGAVLDYMGARPEDDLAPYLREDPRSRVLLIPPRVDVHLLHGDADATVDVDFSRTFPAAFTVLEGADHADLVDPDSPYFPQVVHALLH